MIKYKNNGTEYTEQLYVLQNFTEFSTGCVLTGGTKRRIFPWSKEIKILHLSFSRVGIGPSRLQSHDTAPQWTSYLF